MRTRRKISAYIMRSAAWAGFVLVALVALSSAFDLPKELQKNDRPIADQAKTQSQARALSFAERVVYQRAIEEVYWRHRIWPNENPNPKPALDAVMSQAQLEDKVAGYLRDSLILQDNWQKPITAEQLQTEMDRMARDTKQPEVLRELFEALGNDPAVIAECLARPILAERLIGDLSTQDQTRQVQSLQTDELRAMSVATALGRVIYTLPKIADAGESPCADNTWAATSTSNAPIGRALHTAVWTGVEMIVWSGNGNTGGRYNPTTDSWTATSNANAPSARWGHTAVWSGSEMIVWGGWSFTMDVSTGGKYNPATDTWESTSTTNAPHPREAHSAVWTGSEMIVWGGLFIIPPPQGGGIVFNTGGRYNPSTNSWTATSTSNVPDSRFYHTAVWTGSEMIVWGGSDGNALITGGKFNPITDTWTTTSTNNAPEPRFYHTAVWTGNEMIVWGGDGNNGRVNTGGKYNRDTDSWAATSITNAPSGRMFHTAVWTGGEMIIWGGNGDAAQDLNTGGRYNPNTDSWTATSISNPPSARQVHTAVWTGSEMIVWGGWDDHYVDLNTGGRYCAQSPTPTPRPWPSITPRPQPTYPPRPTRPPRPTAPPR